MQVPIILGRNLFIFEYLLLEVPQTIATLILL